MGSLRQVLVTNSSVKMPPKEARSRVLETWRPKGDEDRRKDRERGGQQATGISTEHSPQYLL